MADDVAVELKEAIDRILASKARKKLVVAGPGAGKTTLFRQLLDSTAGTVDQRLAAISNASSETSISISSLVLAMMSFIALIPASKLAERLDHA